MGRPQTEATRKKISERLKGKKHSIETRVKMSESRKGDKHFLYGKHHSEETKKKISEAQKGRPIPNTHRKKISVSHQKRCANPEVRRKMSESAKRSLSNPDLRKKLSDAQKRRYENPEERMKLSKRLLGRTFTEEHRKKLSESEKGEKNHNWAGGTTNNPYCVLFNDEFRERVRTYYGHICVECGTPQTSRKHTVHHVNYDKEICCNKGKPLFVCLCNRCNVKANRNRPYWEQYFTDMIEGYYQGKCYFTKEEMKEYSL